jgi:hypothetical protein
MTRYRIPAGILRARLEADDQEVLLNPRTGMYHMLNPTASILVSELSGGASLEEAVGVLVEKADVEAGVARADADAFVSDMHSRGLLELE